MNIFALHPNPRKAARWHVDKHVVKMLLETCQLLYTAHWVLWYPELKLYKSPAALSKFQKTLEDPDTLESAPVALSTGEHYRPCHVLHPCARWTRQTLGNYVWLCKLGCELAREFRFRFGHKHSCEAHVKWLLKHPPKGIRPLPKRCFIMAMDEQYKVSNDPIVSYRNYYRTSKKERGLVKYTKRHVPHWLD